MIESKQNARVKHVRKLLSQRKYRTEQGLFVAEGQKLLAEAVRSGADIDEVFLREGVAFSADVQQAQAKGVTVHVVKEFVFDTLSDVEAPQDVVLTCRVRPTDITLQNMRKILVLDALQDPGNLGTILRTADAFALDAVVLCEGCADVYAPKVVRATMGAIFRLPLLRMELEAVAQACTAQNIPLYATALSPQSVAIAQEHLAGACAVIVGNEGHGVSPRGLTLAQKQLMIPMRGSAESLNAAVAASIMIYEMTK